MSCWWRSFGEEGGDEVLEGEGVSAGEVAEGAGGFAVKAAGSAGEGLERLYEGAMRGQRTKSKGGYG